MIKEVVIEKGPDSRAGLVLLAATWFALVGGLIEGAGLVFLQRMNWLGWKIAKVSVTEEILWISPAFNLLLFVLLGLAFVLAARVIPRFPVLPVAVFAFAFLTFWDWMLLSGRILNLGAFVFSLGMAVASVRFFQPRAEVVVRFWKRGWPVAAGLVLAAFAATQGTLWVKERAALARLPAAPARSPNILVIVIDTLRGDHLSSYGYARRTSPTMDRLAAQGTVFETAFATSSWTLPAHASLLTGHYPSAHGAEEADYDGRYPSIAEALQARGYRTAAFSANTINFSRKRGFAPGFIRFEDNYHSLADMASRTLYGRKIADLLRRWEGVGDIPGRKLASDVTQATVRWIRRDPRRPFFAFLNYFDVHDPYLPPHPYREKFSRFKNPGGLINSFMGRDRPEMTPEQLQGEIDAYDGAIAYVDDQIGELLGYLEQAGLSGNTIVVITSDHGEAFGERGLLGHEDSLYWELIHVPLIFHWPGQIPAGLRVARPVTNAALPATLMDLLGASGSAPFPGPSLAGHWRPARADAEWPFPVAELAHKPLKPEIAPAHHGAIKSLTTPRWHYLVHSKFGEELYDWQNDRGELNNLAATPEGRAVAGQLAGRLRELLAESEKMGRSRIARGGNSSP